ncbi:MAG: carboxypeptidase regulatory-like domain-containing protein [Acidobacteriia bacterium]|nr:carboxypeptidase regulatory-like domain-containing protein [Terriglobia bacterium]
MSSAHGSRKVAKGVRRAAVVACMLAVGLVSAGLAQTTISTGSIQGTVLDPSNAAVSGAKVTITNPSTGQVVTTATTSAGTYISGALIPGSYVVRVEAKGFKTAELPLTVQVGVTTSGSVRLEIGQATQVVEVQGTQLAVNTEQATVQGVLTASQIDTLPINGRNFLELAQLEPGVQIQDGGNFDPTKNGFSSVSFGGRFGRTARIEVDGIDISDETVGTTTQNIPEGAIQEFQIGQSSLDLSTELTSSGSVNVVTRSGTNDWHGEAFYYFRDSRVAAALPGGTDSPFQRNQFGGRVGGPVIKDRLFFFLDGERTKQDLQAPVLSGNQFASLSGNFNSPFRETQMIGRLDYQFHGSARMFYRFSFEQNRNVSGFIPNTFQPFANNNHTPVHAFGVDFNTGSYTHSIRVGYTKFRNGITDAVAGTTIFNPAPLLELAIGNDPTCLTAGEDDFCSGPNFLAPQSTFQTDKQFKYDGSRTYHAHIFRYGFGYNRLLGGGSAEFLGLAPAVSSISDPALATGDPSNPLNYPAQQVILGNGQGFSSEKPGFGLPGGGLGPDNRISWYVGDSWKVRPTLTLNVGVRYVRDTGRTDSDIGPIPCSQLDPALAADLAAGGTPCTGNILDLFGPGLGNRVHQPNTNFAPQLGIAWAPWGGGKTVIRGGIGLYYENSIWNNNLFNRPPRLQQGLFLAQQAACSNGNPVSFTLPDGTPVDPQFCNQPIGTVENDIAALQAQYQAATIAAGPAVNSVFIGNTLTSGINATGTNLFAPDYKTARSVQMNIGMQHEFRHGTVLTVDYVRNVATHAQLTVDVNHVGDARYLDTSAALAAINATIANNQGTAGVCPVAVTVGGSSQAAVNCYLGNFNFFDINGDPDPLAGSMADFAQFGMDSGNSFCGGFPCSSQGLPAAAFPGKNKNLGTNQMLFPIGRSVYNGLQISVRQNVNRPMRGIRSMNFQVSYALSKYVATAQDTDFINFAEDNNFPTRFMGPNGLDRRNQISFGGTADLPASFRLSLIGHFYSPLPIDLRLPASGLPGGIFITDVTGDGTGDGTAVSNGGVGDLVPGTKLGGGGGYSSGGSINKLIDAYNRIYAGQLTPAGVALVNAGVVTGSQMSALGGVQQPIPDAPPGQVGLAWLRTMDLKLSWLYKVRESVTIEPMVAFFNVYNLANFDSPASHLSGILDGSIGSANGTTGAQRAAGNTRTGLGTGVFGLGSPRQLEFGLQVSF